MIISVIVVDMPELRSKRSKSVRFDNSVGFATMPAPRGRLRRASKPTPPSNARLVTPPSTGEGATISQSVEAEGIEQSVIEERQVEIAPITTALELRRLVDNLRERLSTGSTYLMSSWTQPGNIISDDIDLLIELTDLRYDCVKWADRYCSHRDEWSSYQLREVSAEVSVKGIRQPYGFDIDWEEAASLRAVYQKVRDLHYEGAKGVRLVVNCHIWLKSATPQLPEIQESQLSQPPPSAQKKRARETVTEKQRRMNSTHRAAAIAVGNFVDQIFQEWVCHDKNCEGYQKPCWRAGTGSHYPLSQDNLKVWSEQINAGAATITDCPHSLIASLMYAKLKTVDSKKKRKTEPTLPLPQQPVSIFMNSWGGPQYPGVGAVPSPKSSPPVQDGQDLDNMRLYLDWLVKGGKISEAHCMLARVGLQDGGFGFNLLREVREIEWVAMEVPRGVQLAILRSQKTWQHDLIRQELAIARRERETEVISSSSELSELDSNNNGQGEDDD